jgi:hypothetical protein
MLDHSSSPPFYTENDYLPHADNPISPEMQANPEIYPFFKNAVCTIDSCHFACFVHTAADQYTTWDCKGHLMQNCLAACRFNMIFYHVFSGWEGTASDATMYKDAHVTDLCVLEERYYLADAGFPAYNSLLIPYQGTHYHLQEWGHPKTQ